MSEPGIPIEPPVSGIAAVGEAGGSLLGNIAGIAAAAVVGIVALAALVIIGPLYLAYKYRWYIAGAVAAAAVGALGLGITGALMIATAAAPAIHGGGTAAVAALLHHFSLTSLAAIGNPANIGEQLLPWVIGAASTAATSFSSWRTWQKIRPESTRGSVENEALGILHDHARNRPRAATIEPGSRLQPAEPSTVFSAAANTDGETGLSVASPKQPPLIDARQRLVARQTRRMAGSSDPAAG